MNLNYPQLWSIFWSFVLVQRCEKLGISCHRSSEPLSLHSRRMEWIQNSSQFQINLLKSFDLERLLRPSSLSPSSFHYKAMLRSAQKSFLPNLIAMKIRIRSPDGMARLCLSATSIKVLLFTVWINCGVKLHFFNGCSIQSALRLWSKSSLLFCFHFIGTSHIMSRRDSKFPSHLHLSKSLRSS